MAELETNAHAVRIRLRINRARESSSHYTCIAEIIQVEIGRLRHEPALRRKAVQRRKAVGLHAAVRGTWLQTVSELESHARPRTEVKPSINNIRHWRVDFLLPAHRYGSLGDFF